MFVSKTGVIQVVWRKRFFECNLFDTCISIYRFFSFTQADKGRLKYFSYFITQLRLPQKNKIKDYNKIKTKHKFNTHVFELRP